MDMTTFQGHLLLLAEATNKELSEPLVRLWWRKYGLLDEAVFVSAIDRATDTCTFWPSPAEFNAAIEAVMTPDERGIQDGIRLLRSWVAHGVIPSCDPGEFAAIKRALGLPPPSAAEVAKVEARAAGLRRDDATPTTPLPAGPVIARLLGHATAAPRLARGA